MLSKGIIFLIIWLLFVSRLIPKYNIYLESNQVQLFGHSWEEQTGLMVLVGIVILGIVVLGSVYKISICILLNKVKIKGLITS